MTTRSPKTTSTSPSDELLQSLAIVRHAHDVGVHLQGLGALVQPRLAGRAGHDRELRRFEHRGGRSAAPDRLRWDGSPTARCAAPLARRRARRRGCRRRRSESRRMHAPGGRASRSSACTAGRSCPCEPRSGARSACQRHPIDGQAGQREVALDVLGHASCRAPLHSRPARRRPSRTRTAAHRGG